MSNKFSQSFLAILYNLLIDSTSGSVFKLLTVRQLINSELFFRRLNRVL